MEITIYANDLWEAQQQILEWMLEWKQDITEEIIIHIKPNKK